jgi:lipoyl(octanoyl) transferase
VPVSSPYAARRLPHRVAAGSWNMAADLALLEWVSEAPSRVVFRTYGWERPTLSLGRREPYPGPWDEGALARAGIDVARRPTGGNAVLHVEEVTFALAAGLPGPWTLTPRGFATAAAEALAEALRACGLPGPALAGGSDSPRRHESPCFAQSAPGEVLGLGYKVAGLASRFAREGALCHASVPLTARSRSLARYLRDGAAQEEALERNARSVGELVGDGNVDLLSLHLRAALSEALATRFGVRWTEGSFEEMGIAGACEPASSR